MNAETNGHPSELESELEKALDDLQPNSSSGDWQSLKAWLRDRLSEHDWKQLDQYEQQLFHQTEKPKMLSSKRRYKSVFITFSVITVMAFGMTIVLFNRANLETPIATPTATPGVAVSQKPEGLVAARNDRMIQALREIQDQQAAIDATRRDYILATATQEARKQGIGIEAYLIQGLQAQKTFLHRELGAKPELSGDAAGISTARSLLLDTKARLQGLQTIYGVAEEHSQNHQNNRVDLSSTATSIGQIVDLSRSIEQQQRK